MKICFVLAYYDLGLRQINAGYNSFTLQWATPSNYCGLSNMNFSIKYNGSQLSSAGYSIVQIGKKNQPFDCFDKINDSSEVVFFDKSLMSDRFVGCV